VVGSSTLTCSGETYTANAPAGTTNVLSFTPNYINCKTEGAAFNNVTVTHNGCNFNFTSTGPIHIACPIGKTIEVHHYSSTANHTAGTSSCTETIGSQTAVGNATYTNLVSGSVETSGSVTVTLQTHGACSFGFTINQEATYTFSDTVTATSKEAIHVK